jgi:hypothetical protein
LFLAREPLMDAGKKLTRSAKTKRKAKKTAKATNKQMKTETTA